MTKYQEKHKSLVPLIDGDILTYRLGFAADSGAKKESPEGWQDLNYLEWALHLVDNQMKAILEMFNGNDTSWLYLSGKENYRDKVATIKPYKGNRDPSKRPKYYKELRDYMVEQWGAIVTEGIEADDALGTHQFNRRDKSTVICSIDKDLNMIPGYHFNFVKGEFYDTKLAEANLFFFRQMLIGDSTDNIPGIRGIAEKTACKHLPDGCEEAYSFQTIGKLYKEHYKEKAAETAEEVARLLWIRRNANEEPWFLEDIKAAASA